MKYATLFLLLAVKMSFLIGELSPTPLVVVGGGYFDAGSHHSGGVWQLEYRCGRTLFCQLRPQACLILPELQAVFFGMGLGIDLYASEHVVFTPSFSPGLYYQGRSRDLGYPIEFRAALELSYEWSNCVRVGCQIYHISNASLSHRNPGANALTLIVAFPFLIR